MNNNTITIEYLVAQQHCHMDQQPRENSTQDQSNQETFINNNNKTKKRPMARTPLYFSFLLS